MSCLCIQSAVCVSNPRLLLCSVVNQLRSSNSLWDRNILRFRLNINLYWSHISSNRQNCRSCLSKLNLRFSTVKCQRSHFLLFAVSSFDLLYVCSSFYLLFAVSSCLWLFSMFCLSVSLSISFLMYFTSALYLMWSYHLPGPSTPTR